MSLAGRGPRSGVLGRPLQRDTEDDDRGEKETLSWKVLIPKKWNKTTQYGWRYDPRDVARTTPAAAPEAATECECDAAGSEKKMADFGCLGVSSLMGEGQKGMQIVFL